MDELKQCVGIMSGSRIGGLLHNFQKSGLANGTGLLLLQPFQALEPRNVPPAFENILK